MTQEQRTHAITIITQMIDQLGREYMPLYTDALDVALDSLNELNKREHGCVECHKRMNYFCPFCGKKVVESFNGKKEKQNAVK